MILGPFGLLSAYDSEEGRALLFWVGEGLVAGLFPVAGDPAPEFSELAENPYLLRKSCIGARIST